MTTPRQQAPALTRQMVAGGILRRSCACGAGIVVAGPAAAADIAAFERDHVRPGCAPVRRALSAEGRRTRLKDRPM